LGLQTKLKVNEPGDIYEQEADRIADQVLTAPLHSDVSGAPIRIQHFSGQTNGQTAAAPASVDVALSDPGRPLKPALRQDMEQRFGHDFSRVRVHNAAAAERSARDVSAFAYTVGENIVFGAGRYAPGTSEGQRLLAHELTHVIQQSAPEEISISESNKTISSGSFFPHGERRPGIGNHLFRQTTGGSAGEGPTKRIIYLDANVFDEINRGNTRAADLLRNYGQTAEVHIGNTVYQQLVVKPNWPETRTANRILIEDLHIQIDPELPKEKLIERATAGWETGKEKEGRGGIRTQIVPTKDVPVVAEIPQGAEFWTFERFRKNAARIEEAYRIRFAPETLTIEPSNDPSYYSPGGS
jgi:hypothetical protein